MTSEEPGPRDHLITRALERRLVALESELLTEQPLDPAEGPQRLARHTMEQIRGDLAGLETADDQAVASIGFWRASGHATVLLPRPSELRRAPRRAPRLMHVATAATDARGLSSIAAEAESRSEPSGSTACCAHR